MTWLEKQKFIRDLCNTVKIKGCRKARAMPRDWDGHELRQWLADEFARQTSSVTRPGTQRRKDYDNIIATTDL